MKHPVLEIVLRNLLKYSPLIVLSVLLLYVGTLARSYYLDAQDSKSKYEKLIGVEEQYKQVSGNLADLQRTYADDKQLWAKAKEDWGKERDQLKGQIKTLASASFTIKNFPHEQGAPDLVTDEYMKQEVRYSDGTTQGPPVGYVQIFKGTGRTISSMYHQEIGVKSVVTRTDDGRYHVLVKGESILLDDTTLRPEWIGVPYPLEITGGEVWINPNTQGEDHAALARRFLTTLTPNVGMFAGSSSLGQPEYGVHADMTLWGYGKSVNDLDWKLGGLGVNFSKGYFDVNLNPVHYRVGNYIPVFKDVYVGPGVGLGTSGTTYYLSLTTSL